VIAPRNPLLRSAFGSACDGWITPSISACQRRNSTRTQFWRQSRTPEERVSLHVNELSYTLVAIVICLAIVEGSERRQMESLVALETKNIDTEVFDGQ
jgi:hypothetical protein